MEQEVTKETEGESTGDFFHEMYLLQETLFCHPEFPDSLYLRLNSPSGRDLQEALNATESNTCFEIFQGEVLSTNTFFGSFYRAYWQRYAPFGKLKVRIGFSGEISLRILEDVDGKVHLRSVVKIKHVGTKTALVDFSTDHHETDTHIGNDASGRVFVEIEATQASVIRTLDFVSPDTAPGREINLSIGLCTFNQEVYLGRTLKELSGLLATEPCLKTIYLVNQSNSFHTAAIHEQLKSPRIKLIEQRNLGGCGGFTRTLVEAQHASVPASHHLLMDDDILIDARIIPRAIRFLSYAKQDIVLGGAMLDAMFPTVMYEAGVRLRRDNTIERNCHGADLSDQKSLHHFSKVTEIDYNAWWFCILPINRIKEIGLPGPVFIRGDDIEYGQRMADAGVATVALPGIAVWHEPFYVKPDGWQAYYDLRNRLIFAASYPHKVRQLSIVSILGILLKPSLSHQYMSAQLRLQAVADFLKGPDLLFARDPEAIHTEVMDLGRNDALVTLDQAEWVAKPLRKATPDTRARPLLALRFISSLLATGLRGQRKEEVPIFLDINVHAVNTKRRSYVVTNSLRSYHQLFVPNRRRLWQLVWQLCVITIRYAMQVRRSSQAWKIGMKSYCRPDYWQRLFYEPVDESHQKPAQLSKQGAEANE